MAEQFILKAGIEFAPTDASKRSIQRAVNAALADFEVKIEKAKLTNSAISQIREQLSQTVFTLGRVSLSGEAIRSIKGQLLEINLPLGRVEFAAEARRTLINQFSQIPFIVKNVTIASAAQRRIAEIAGQSVKIPTENIGGVSGAANKLREIQDSIRRTFSSASAGIVPERSLEGLVSSQQRAAIEASKLQRSFQQLGPAAGKAVTQAADGLTKLRQVLGEVAQRAGIVVGDTLKLDQAVSASASSINGQNAAFQTQTRILSALNAEQQKFISLQKGQTFGTTKVTGQVAALQNVRAKIEEVVASSKGLIGSNKLVESSFQGTGLSLESFGAKLLTITARFGTYLVAIKAVLAVQQAFRFSLDSIVEFDNVIQELRKVLQGTPAELAALSQSIFTIAKNTGAGLDAVSSSLNNFVREGGTVEDALRRTNAALIAVNVTELNSAEATKFITSATRIFGKELQNEIQALDILSTAADNAATTAGEVGRAFINTSGAAQLAGVSFNELIALLTATIERTQESGSKVGNAFKTILTRIKNNTNGFREQANALGANIQANDSISDVLSKLSTVFKDLDSNQKTQLATTIAGTRQVNIFTGLVDSLGKAQELLGKQSASTGSALQKQAREQEKISTQVNVLVNGLKEFVAVLSSADEGAGAVGGIANTFRDLLGFLNGTTGVATELVRNIKDVNIEGFKLTSVFSGISKTIFFVAGTEIVRRVVSGIVQAKTVTTQLTGEVANLARALNSAKNITGQQEVAEKRVLAIEQRRVGILEQIVNLKRRSLQVSGGQTAAAGAADEASPGGVARALKTTGLVVGLQLISDRARDTADALEKSSDSVDRLTSAGLKAAASASELGTTIGLITGSVGAGLITALATAAVSIASFALEQNKSAQAIRQAVTDEAKERLSGIEALRTGNAALRQVFEEEARNSGQPVRQVVLQAGVAIERALTLSANKAATALENAGKALEAVRSDITSSVRTLELKQAIQDATEQFRARAARAKLVQAGGPLGNFSEVDEILSSTVTEAEKLIGPVGETGNAVAAQVRSMQAFNALQKDSTVRAADLLRQFQLESPALVRLQQDFDGIKVRIIDSVKELESAKGEVELLRDRLSKVAADAGKGTIAAEAQKSAFEGTRDAGASLSARVAEFNKRIEEGTVKINSLTQNVQELRGQEAILNQEISKASEDNLKQVKDLAANYGKLLEFIRAAVQENAAESVILKDQISDINQEIKFEEQLRGLRRDGLSSVEQLSELQARASREVNVRLQTEDRAEQRLIQRLRERAQLLEIVGDKAKAAETLNLAEQLDQSFQEKRGVLEAQLQAQVQIELDKNLEEFVRQQEKALADSRISAIRRVADEEQRSAERRVKLIQEIGNTPVGKEIFEKALRAVPDQVARQFGRVGAAALQIQEDSLDSFAQSVEREFFELSKTGLTSIEKLTEAQRLQSTLLERNQEQLQRSRDAALDRAKIAVDRVKQSEDALVAARNQIPASNQKILEADKNLANANAEVENATKELVATYQAAADAQAQFRFQIAFAAVQVKQQVGAFSSIGEQFSALQQVFAQVTNEIQVSETTRLQLARQVAQEQLNLLQQQFSAVQSLGAQAATAGADQLAQLQDAVAAAVAIQTGQANVSDFGPELIQQIASLPDALFPGLQRAISEFGLERLGVDPGSLENIADEMTQLARTTAETNKEQVIAANQQVRVAQEQLAASESNRALAQDQLEVAIAQKEAVLRSVAVANVAVSTSRAGFVSTVQQVARTVEAINSTTAATNQVDRTLQNIALIIQQQTSEIRNAVASARSAGIPNAAGGTLTGGELAGLAAAAKREKRAMPTGSRLMVANTSETVLTRRQARSFGLRPILRSNAAEGNAATDTAALQQTVGLLNTTVNSLLARVNSPGFIQQNIEVAVNTEKTVNLRGADAFEDSVRRTLQDRLGRLSSKEDVDAIAGALSAVVQRLNENGIVSAGGT